VASQNLASRYCFEPLFALELEGDRIAEHLAQLFHRRAAPLLFTLPRLWRALAEARSLLADDRG